LPPLRATAAMPAGLGDGFCQDLMGPRPSVLEHKGQTLLSSPPRFTERKPARAPENEKPASAAGPTAPLAERLVGMSDHMLRAYQSSAQRVSADPAHPKHAAAQRAVPLIAAEILRRTNAIAAAGAPKGKTR
jgi:hypothetical protein